MYRSPSTCFDTFLESLEGLLTATDACKQIILTGDFNVHFNTTEPYCVRLCDLLGSFDLWPTVFEQTRYHNCLDNIFVNSDLKVRQVQAVDVGISDHKGQLLNFFVDTNAVFTQNKIFRPITQKGLNEFYNLLEGVSWDFINSDALNIEQKFEKFMKILEDAYLCCFPEKKYIVRSDQGNNITWFNQELREMREHLTLLGDMKNNCYTSTREYRNFRALYRQRIKQAKIIANDNLILRSNNSVKTMWHIINTQRGKPKNSSVESNLSPDEFNTFFSNIADNIVKQIPIPGIDYKHYLSLITPPLEGFSFSEMTFNDVRAVIDRLKNKKSCDLFGFNTKLIKTVKNIILIPLTKLINSCFREKKFPELLKKAIIIPIFKNGDPNFPGNYRPISLLPIVSKIFEKCMALQLVAFFEKNGLFSSSQFGFRQGKSTTMAILDLTSRILEAFHNKQYISVNFCDLSKAFDCVDHKILLEKLKFYNFDENSIELLASYLKDRCQSVKCKGVASAERVVNKGVPQGSILGPILFLIYINDLPATVTTAGYTLFADDTTLSYVGTTLEDSVVGSRDSLELTIKWLQSNSLFLNQDKTKQMIFAMRDIGEDLGGNVQEARFLGVTLDTRLQWGRHIDLVAKKLTKAVFVIRGLSNCVSPPVLRTAYFAIFQPHISYAILAWGHSAEVHRLFAIQRKLVRIISGLGYREDCREAFIALSILTVPALYIWQNLLFIKKANNFQSHADVHNYNTRKRANLVPSYCRLRRCQDGPNYWAIKLFNTLPNSIRELPYHQFYSRTKETLTNNAFYSIEEFLCFNFVT
nr:unnamed protein product [Callosobruchus analis]